MTRIRLINVRREGSTGYLADLELDGCVVGRVQRADRPSGLGYRSGAYKATVGGRTVAAGDTLRDLKLDLTDPDTISEMKETTE